MAKQQNTNADPTTAWEAEGGKALTGGGFWKPDKAGDNIRGVLVRLRDGRGEFKQRVADLKVGDTLHSVGLTEVLESRITDDMVGREIGIIFRGMEKSEHSNASYKMFDVYQF